jgi:glucose-6-phosphate dehydrogenase assembly protein OpcA
MTAAPASPPLAEFKPAALADVERELGRLMKSAQGPGEQPVIQARMSNLVVFCNRAEVAAGVAAVLDEIVQGHPARVLLLVGEPGPDGADIEAGVRVCDQRRGTQQVCSEQVLLRARDRSLDRLPFAVRSLLIGDLPTNLWWASAQPPPLAGPLLYDLAESAQQLVYDSQGWLDPHRAVAATSSWLTRFERSPGQGRWRVASDLNWRRLKFWRRLLAQSLDAASAPGAAESITDVLVEHGPHAVTQAWELVGWLAARLNWRVQAARVQLGVDITWKVTAPKGSLRLRICRLPEGPSEVRHVHIACTLGSKAGALDFGVEEGTRLTAVPVGVAGSARTLNAQQPSLAQLVSRQLSDREPNPVFRESMAVARVFAQSVLT